MRLVDHFRYRADVNRLHSGFVPLGGRIDDKWDGKRVEEGGRAGHVNLVSAQVINTTTFVRRGHLFI